MRKDTEKHKRKLAVAASKVQHGSAPDMCWKQRLLPLTFSGSNEDVGCLAVVETSR